MSLTLFGPILLECLTQGLFDQSRLALTAHITGANMAFANQDVG
jgi:hypothetical protein